MRNIRSTRNRMTTRPDYYHVLGHMDDHLLWPAEKAPLETRLALVNTSVTFLVNEANVKFLRRRS